MNLFVKTNIRFVINRNKLALWTKLVQTDRTVIEIYTYYILTLFTNFVVNWFLTKDLI